MTTNWRWRDYTFMQSHVWVHLSSKMYYNVLICIPHQWSGFQSDFWPVSHVKEKKKKAPSYHLRLPHFPLHCAAKHWWELQNNLRFKAIVDAARNSSVHFVPLTNLSLMSSSIILHTVSAMRPQTTACCFCCLSAFNGLTPMLACSSACAPRVMRISLYNFPAFSIAGCKTRQCRLKTMRNWGVRRRQGEGQKPERKKSECSEKNKKPSLSISALLSPACAWRPRSSSSLHFFRPPDSTEGGRRAERPGVSMRAGLPISHVI